MTTKADIINGAYSHIRISGLTVEPGPEENVKALDRLENMAAELYGNNIDTGYNFEDSPDINSNHNMKRRFWLSYQVLLAQRLANDYGKQIPPSLALSIKAASSYLSARTAEVNPVEYPSRQPLGSGNRRGRTYYRFFSQETQPPVSSATVKLAIGDISNRIEHFDAYLNLVDAESIASFTIDSDTGLTVVSSSISDNDVIYQVEAEGGSTDVSSSLYQVVIVITTSTGRKTTRLINFSLTTIEI